MDSLVMSSLTYEQIRALCSKIDAEDGMWQCIYCCYACRKFYVYDAAEDSFLRCQKCNIILCSDCFNAAGYTDFENFTCKECPELSANISVNLNREQLIEFVRWVQTEKASACHDYLYYCDTCEIVVLFDYEYPVAKQYDITAPFVVKNCFRCKE